MLSFGGLVIPVLEELLMVLPLNFLIYSMFVLSIRKLTIRHFWPLPPLTDNTNMLYFPCHWQHVTLIPAQPIYIKLNAYELICTYSL